MTTFIPEYLLDSEKKADAMITFATANPLAANFERKLITISIALRKTESKGTQLSNEMYFNAIKVVLIKKGYTYNSICRAANFISGNKKPVNFNQLSADEQNDYWANEYEQAISILEK